MNKNKYIKTEYEEVAVYTCPNCKKDCYNYEVLFYEVLFEDKVKTKCRHCGQKVLLTLD